MKFMVLVAFVRVLGLFFALPTKLWQMLITLLAKAKIAQSVIIHPSIRN